jgi:monothiol glutaredoxin
MSDPVHDRIASLVAENKVLLFMRGTPYFPQCGFSSTAIAILERLGVAFESVDVLADPEIRQGIKTFSDWPTIPQLYINGEFVGGSDIMMEMFQDGELAALLEQAGAAPSAA